MKPIISNSKLIIAGLATMSMLASSIAFASGSSQQKNKNLWRNLGTGAGVVAAHGLLTGNKTEALLGLAGGAYSANRYETDRHHQSQNSAAWKAKQRAAQLNRSKGSRTRKYYTYNNSVYVYNPQTGSRTQV